MNIHDDFANEYLVYTHLQYNECFSGTAIGGSGEEAGVST